MAPKQSIMMCISMLCMFTMCYADTAFYSIWPTFSEDGMSAVGTDNRQLTIELQKDLNNDPSKLYVSRSTEPETTRTWYWFAELTDELFLKWSSKTGIAHVATPIDDENYDMRRRAVLKHRNFANDTVVKTNSATNEGSTTTDSKAPNQLKIVSLPKGADLAESKGYKYLDSAGEGINLYIIDTGLVKGSDEFKDRTVSYMFTGPFPGDTEGDDENAHGSCMASVAMGNTVGVARKSSVTAVKVGNGKRPVTPIESLVDGLAQIFDDVLKKKAKGKGVISMSIGLESVDDKDYQFAFSSALTTLLNELDALDIPQTAAVPNEGSSVNQYPAVLAKPIPGTQNPLVKNLIPVGGARINDGDFYNNVRDDVIKIYGPADDASKGKAGDPGLLCVQADGKVKPGNQGTSIATAMVAGELAYYMGTGLSGADARALVYSSAVVRKDKGPPMMYNGQDSTA